MIPYPASFCSQLGIIALAVASLLSPLARAAENPFADSAYPAPAWYSGPDFKLSHDYASAPVDPSKARPWTQDLAGAPISRATAPAYTASLKTYIATDMQTLLLRFGQWDAAKSGWYNQPWLSTIREPIHGMFVGTQTSGSLFNDPALTAKVVNNFVSVYYDKAASYTLGKFWKGNAMEPDFSKDASQFQEGAVIVKFAFSEVSGTEWPVMKGAPRWQIYAKRLDETTGLAGDVPEMFDVFLMQMDVIVKDTKASPKTGWVFSTFVFDNTVNGGAWDKLVPLGAMWGNDPAVNSTLNAGAPLQETWINSGAPAYSLATLGWGGRLSGPNDQAVQAPGDYIDPATSLSGTRAVANSSCMSCHGPAEWPARSFILPGAVANNQYYLPVSGSPQWMPWFQDRAGTEPQDPGTDALDYDMMFAFKALPHWANATGKSAKSPLLFVRPSELHIEKEHAQFLEPGYNGLPFKAAPNAK